MGRILAIDQSTSATKAAVFDEFGLQLCEASLAHRQLYPRPGFVEHDAEEIYSNTVKACKLALDRLQATVGGGIDAIGIANQRETVLLWDDSGKPVCNAIVWQDGRADRLCRGIASAEAAHVKVATGLPLSPLFSAAKAAWLLREHDLMPLAKAGRVHMGTIDSWLIRNLTGAHLTDITNACRTQLMNLKTLQWDADCLRIFGIPAAVLPEIRPCDSVFGYTDLEGLLPNKVPVCGVMGDSHAALFAQGCFEKGSAKATYGTGSSVMLNTGSQAVRTSDLAATVGWGRSGRVCYVLEGNISHAADTIGWLTDIGLLQNPSGSGEIAAKLPDNGGVYMVPAFSGLGAPWWQPQARALLCGITRDTAPAHFVRAALEAIAYQVQDVLQAMANAAGVKPGRLMADGGPTGNSFLMQFQADISGVAIDVAEGGNLSLRGAAFMAGIACGIFADEQEVAKLRASRAVYERTADSAAIEQWLRGWRQALARTVYQP